MMKDKALLIATHRGASEKQECQDHLDELAFLADTFGVEVFEQKLVPMRKMDSATFIGSGKVEELVQEAKAFGIKVIIFDDSISPAQQRNLEGAFGTTVMDRTELILGVFEQRAQTKEARLQVELAGLRYQKPRLKRLWTHLHRQSGSGKSGLFVKGEGEKQIEIDRRILKKQILLLEKEILEVEKHRVTQRHQRVKKGVPTFALIGYTNVGKSTLLNAMTDAGVFVEDKLFATLDTTTRKYELPNNQEVLLIDTVGFIRKLPHLLVAAFKGTLEESMHADILLHLIDVSNPLAEAQADASYEVLKELNAEDIPVITVLNKIDALEDKSRILYFRMKYPRCVPISAKTGEGFDTLVEAMCEELSKTRRKLLLRIPQSDYAAVTEVMESGTIFHQDYEENDVLLRCELPAAVAGRLKKYEVTS